MTFLSAAMSEAMAHRGPDDSGTWVDHESGVAIASLRLVVIGLSPASHQPMPSKSGQYVIVFNEKIYNHLKNMLKTTLNSYKNFCISVTSIATIQWLYYNKHELQFQINNVHSLDPLV